MAGLVAHQKIAVEGLDESCTRQLGQIGVVAEARPGSVQVEAPKPLYVSQLFICTFRALSCELTGFFSYLISAG